MRNNKIFSFLEINFYAILKYAVNDSEIHFSEKNIQKYKICWKYHLTVSFHSNSQATVLAFHFPKICTNWCVVLKVLGRNCSSTIDSCDLHWLSSYRSSRPEVFCKKGVLRNLAKFIEKHLCQRLFFNKAAGLRHRSQVIFKKSLWHRCFPVNFAKFLRTLFFT